MLRSLVPLFLRFGLALIAVGVMACAQLLLGSSLSVLLPCLLFYLSIGMTTWYGGVGTGLAATVLAALAFQAFFLPSFLAFTAVYDQIVFQILLLVGGSAVVLASAWLAQAQEVALPSRVAEFEALMEALPAVIWVAHDAACQRVSGNHKAYELMRQTPGSNLSLTATSGRWPANLKVRVNGQDVPPEKLPLHQAVFSGKPVLGAEGEVRFDDGTVHHIYGNAVPLFYNGVVQGGLAAFIDIGARKRAELDLRESEDRFRTLANAAPVLVWMSGADRRWHYFNQPWLDFTGRTLEQACGLGWIEGIHPEDVLGCMQAYETACAAQRPFEIEYRLRRHDGQYRHMLDRGVPRRTADGQLLGYIGSCLDITDRKDAEASLLESEARFRQLADAMPQVVWAARADGRLQYANRRWEEIAGLQPRSGFFLDEWWPLLHPDDLERCTREWQDATSGGRVYQVECRFRDRCTGGYRWFLCRSVPVCDATGHVARWYGTCTDIDDQKRSEEALKEAARRKDQFLAMLSHELRNPLAPILNSLQLLCLADLPDATLGDARNVIDRQVRQLAGIIDDLLDTFQVTHHKTELQRVPVNLAGLVGATLDDHRQALKSAGLTLELELPTEPVWVLGEPRRLAQIMARLLQNATKFTRAGDRLAIHLAVDRPQQRAVVVVKDSGIGMTPDVLAHAFDTFTQAEQSLDRRQGGLGLGLALVRGLVELHGGEVRAASDGPGRGAEFSFWLPLIAEPSWVDKEPVPARSFLRILIVEDSPDTARTLQILLQRFGHEVAIASTGPAGIAMARQKQPDVVLCDLGLPELDGYEVARRLRDDPQTAAIRFIAISGYNQDEDRRRSREAGFELHLAKPVDPVDLQQLLCSLASGP